MTPVCRVSKSIVHTHSFYTSAPQVDEVYGMLVFKMGESMSWFNTFILGSVGYVLGGPIGALLGGVAGHALGDAKERAEAGKTGTTTTQRANKAPREAVFFTTVFALLGKLAKADGVVCREEISVVESFMRDCLRLEDAQRQMAIRLFSAAKDSETSYRDYAIQFASFFQHSKALREQVLTLLYQVAAADKVLHEGERVILEDVSQIFGFSDAQELAIKELFFSSAESDYRILGVDASAPLDEIKKRYRELALEHHPDKLMASGMPEEFVEAATHKLQLINRAYDNIKNQRSV